VFAICLLPGPAWTACSEPDSEAEGNRWGLFYFPGNSNSQKLEFERSALKFKFPAIGFFCKNSALEISDLQKL